MGQAKLRGTYAERKANPNGRKVKSDGHSKRWTNALWRPDPVRAEKFSRPPAK